MKINRVTYGLCLLFIVVMVCNSINSNDRIIDKQFYFNELLNDKNDINEIWRLSNPIQKGIVTVSIIDTGINIEHEALCDSMWINENETPNDNIDNDNNGYIDDCYGYNSIASVGINDKSIELLEDNHGTAIAGVIKAIYEKGSSVTGIHNNSKIKLMQIKAIDIEPLSRSNSIENIINAINYAEENNANICNLSFTFDYSNEKILAVIKKSPMLFIIAAGNSCPYGISVDNKMTIISRMQNVLIVANTNSAGEIDKNSNYGKESVHIAAPGCNVLTTSVDGSYKYVTGTSFSCAAVSGVAALVYQRLYHICPYDVKKLIIESVTRRDSLETKVKSKGYINVDFL